MALFAAIVFKQNVSTLVDQIGAVIAFFILLSAFGYFLYRAPLRRSMSRFIGRMISRAKRKRSTRSTTRDMHERLRRDVEVLQQELAALESRLSPSDSENDVAALAAYRAHLNRLSRQAAND